MLANLQNRPVPMLEMLTRGRLAFLLAVLLLPLLPVYGEGRLARQGGWALPSRIDADKLGKLPLLFEPNAGQADPSARFLARSAGSTLLFDSSGVTLALQQSAGGVASNAAAVTVAHVRFLGVSTS